MVEKIRKTRPKKYNKTKIQKITPLLLAGCGEREIAGALKCSKTSVHYQIHRNFTDLQLQKFKESEADDLRAFRLEYLQSIDPAAIKKMIATRGMVDYGIAYDKEVLERGHSPASKPILVVIKGDNARVQVNTGAAVDPVLNPILDIDNE